MNFELYMSFQKGMRIVVSIMILISGFILYKNMQC